MAEIWGAAIAAVAGIGTAVYSSNQQKKAAQKALDAQRGIATDIKYEPIDVEKLRADATSAAIDNATNSLAIERQLQPSVASTREELARQIDSELKQGGNLNADTINQVNAAGRVIGGRSGVGAGGTVPLTAALLGLSSIDLANQRRQAASNLLGANPLPTAGLDPGTLASVEVAQNAANNQFNLEKSGVESNLVQSEAEARAAQVAGQAGIISSLGNLAGQIYNKSNQPKSNYEDLIKKVPKTKENYLNQNPSTNPLMSSSILGLT